jgi:ParB-like chromosome segregation protein Spo0J
MNPNSIIIRTESVPIDQLVHYRENPRIGDVDTIMDSLAFNGQYRALIVNQRTNEVLAGNHTLKAAKALDWEVIDVSWVDVDDEVAKRIVLVDNRASDDASYDDLLLAAILGEMREEDEVLLEGTGYSAEDVDEMLANALLFEPDDEEDEEHVSSISAMLNRIMPLSTEEQLEQDARNQKKLIDAANRAAELKSNMERPMERPVDYVIFQFGELRAKVLKTTYDEFMGWFLAEHANLSEAGVAAALKLGFGADDVKPGVSEGVERCHDRSPRSRCHQDGERRR